MKNKFFDNADCFSMSFDEEWQNFKCDDLKIKMQKVLDRLCDHPFMISNPTNAIKIAEFRVFSLKKFE